ncbi:hypothetical protein N0K08_09785 [Acidovorax sp. Be4]|uniref:PLD phosphodiesterase domain-containing protein n=1 Tax=Acidovorax bellezanensis TaxID=2976702 RepID=A0ABT2PKC7_9BURK|nr:hypothetical protein [Acidovorax sp. Be4]MCT9810926.1 hypothetical protein [Acidovorax sp. Be4]
MPTERYNLETLFTPPPGEHGTHALLCGLSADVPVLQRALAAFTCETPVERQASGLVRSLLLLDASSRRIPPTAVPGLLHLAPCVAAAWQKRTTLLHAKVALLGFGASRYAETTRWRLIVSTGNWTEATWSRQAQIDFFWKTEWAADDADGDQALVDVAAAFDFFQRLLSGLYGDHLDKLETQPLAIDWLDAWRIRLSKAVKRIIKPPVAQFVHSLSTPLATQIRERFPTDGINTLVAGSGFFEQAVTGSSSQPEVLHELEKLGRPGTRYLVFNTSQAGQLANWIGKRKLKDGHLGKWHLCKPCDPLQKGKAPGRSLLHAKYVAGLGPVRSGSSKVGFLYIGSGNLSRRGYMNAARLGRRGSRAPSGALGNVEAGAVLIDGGKVNEVWKRLACGAFATNADIAAAITDDGEPLFTPADPPPLLLARYLHEDAAGPSRLLLERSAVAAQPLWIQVADGDWIAAAADASSVPWPSPVAPTVLRVRSTSADGTQQEWEVPVFSADGLFCRRPMPQVPFGSVLKALLAFPAPPPLETDYDDEDIDDGGGAKSRGALKASPYPLRSLAAMIEAIADRNEAVTREEFPYWLGQLRVLLLEQTADADRQGMMELGVDLFDALLEPGFTPAWLAGEPALQAQYSAVVDQLRAGWCATSGG